LSFTGRRRAGRRLAFVLSFDALGLFGYQIYLTAPAIPTAVVTTDGDTLFQARRLTPALPA